MQPIKCLVDATFLVFNAFALFIEVLGNPIKNAVFITNIIVN